MTISRLSAKAARRGATLVALVVSLGACDGDGAIVRAPGADEASVDSVAVTPPTARLDQVGQTQTFVATPLNAAGDTLSVEVAWASSDVAVATMSPSGEATAQGPGQVDITATVGDVTGRAVLTVSLIAEP